MCFFLAFKQLLLEHVPIIDDFRTCSLLRSALVPRNKISSLYLQQALLQGSKQCLHRLFLFLETSLLFWGLCLVKVRVYFHGGQLWRSLRVQNAACASQTLLFRISRAFEQPQTLCTRDVHSHIWLFNVVFPASRSRYPGDSAAVRNQTSGAIRELDKCRRKESNLSLTLWYCTLHSSTLLSPITPPPKAMYYF